MTFRRSEAFGSKPVLLFLHGAGSSAAIFRVQTYFLAKALSPYFDLVYVDAPVRSGPGPGVLPYFQGMEAYYRWFDAGGLGRGVTDLLDVTRQGIPRQLEAQGVRSRDVAGVVGFSQGALAALGLLGVGLATGSPQWGGLRFCVAMGGATGGGAAHAAVARTMAAAGAMLGGNGFPGHTVHVMGRRDPWVRDSRQIAGMCSPRRTKVVEFDGGHWVPRDKHDISRVVHVILETELDSRRDADDASSSSSEDEVEVLMRRLDATSAGP